jgi:uncharacterized protein (DUF427 family)
MRVQAIWNGEIIADSDDTMVIEGNHYFPRSSVDDRFVMESGKTTVCPWKGVASYLTVTAGGGENPDAAWYYPTPKPSADMIAGRVAFSPGVEIVEAVEVDTPAADH